MLFAIVILAVFLAPSLENPFLRSALTIAFFHSCLDRFISSSLKYRFQIHESRFREADLCRVFSPVDFAFRGWPSYCGHNSVRALRTALRQHCPRLALPQASASSKSRAPTSRTPQMAGNRCPVRWYAGFPAGNAPKTTHASLPPILARPAMREGFAFEKEISTGICRQMPRMGRRPNWCDFSALPWQFQLATMVSVCQHIGVEAGGNLLPVLACRGRFASWTPPHTSYALSDSTTDDDTLAKCWRSSIGRAAFP